MKFFSSISRVRVVLFIAAALSMLWGYRLLLLEHAPGVFNGEMEDLSYGWYVPVFSLYVLWRTRRELLLSVGEASPWGVLISLPFFFVGFLLSNFVSLFINSEYFSMLETRALHSSGVQFKSILFIPDVKRTSILLERGAKYKFNSTGLLLPKVDLVKHITSPI
jgi:hypothetical protein